MYHVEIRELVQSKQAIGKAGYKEVKFSVVCSALDLGLVLHKIMSLYDSPLQRAFVVFLSIEVAVCG